MSLFMSFYSFCHSKMEVHELALFIKNLELTLTSFPSLLLTSIDTRTVTGSKGTIINDVTQICKFVTQVHMAKCIGV